MTIATFTLDDADPAALRFPIVQQRHRIDVLRTLLKLEELKPGTPLLLEEQYVQKRDGLNLLLRLRLEPALVASRSPIYVRLQSRVEDHIRHHPKYAVLCSRGVALLSGDQEPDDVDAPETLTEVEGDDPLLSVLESLVVQGPSAQTRHDLANEWGPHRLWRGYAQLAGLEDEPEWARDAFLRLRQQEYYAYLLGLAALRSPQHTQPADADAADLYEAFLDGYRGPVLRVLLLDDEIDKGWGDAVREVLERPGVLEVNTDLEGVDFDAEGDHVAEIVDPGWDLVLADLRTTPGDRAQSPARGVRQYGGAAWIERIKGKHPETAVVAFTASNKAWSVQELRDMGVDGYWVKESPEFGVDDGYSVANAARLLDTVRLAFAPRVVARPIWTLLQRLEEKVGSGRKSPYMEGWVREGGQPAKDVRVRLFATCDRLRRAYGLLLNQDSDHARGAFRLHAYNLSYLTLWSVLNEVSGLYLTQRREGRPNKPWEEHSLSAWKDVEFFVRDPKDGAFRTYWHVREGDVVSGPTLYESGKLSKREERIQGALCRVTGSGPQFPGGDADTRLVEWLLARAGRPDLLRRFTAGRPKHDGARPGLRHLRNNLEEAHGRLEEVWYAAPEDIADLCEVWEALLIDPYPST